MKNPLPELVFFQILCEVKAYFAYGKISRCKFQQTYYVFQQSYYKSATCLCDSTKLI